MLRLSETTLGAVMVSSRAEYYVYYYYILEYSGGSMLLYASNICTYLPV